MLGHLRLLLAKTLRERRRGLVGSVLQLCLPLVFLATLGAIRLQVPRDKFYAHGVYFPTRTTATSGVPALMQSNCPPTPQFGDPLLNTDPRYASPVAIIQAALQRHALTFSDVQELLVKYLPRPNSHCLDREWDTDKWLCACAKENRDTDTRALLEAVLSGDFDRIVNDTYELRTVDKEDLPRLASLGSAVAELHGQNARMDALLAQLSGLLQGGSVSSNNLECLFLHSFCQEDPGCSDSFGLSHNLGFVFSVYLQGSLYVVPEPGNTTASERVVHLMNQTYDQVGAFAAAMYCVDQIATTPRPVTSSDPGMVQERWFKVAGNSVGSLYSNPAYPDHPDATYLFLAASLDRSPSIGEFYGERLRGRYRAPATGSYTFSVRADDAAEVYLGADASPASKRLVAATNLADHSLNRAETVQLEAGSVYYLELTFKEQQVTDRFHVRVVYPNGTKGPLWLAGNVLLPDPLIGDSTSALLRADPGPLSFIPYKGNFTYLESGAEFELAMGNRDHERSSYFGGVFFNNLSLPELEYKLRLHDYLMPPVDRQTFTHAQSWEYRNIFLHIQDSLDHALLALHGATNSAATFFGPFPVPPKSTTDIFQQNVDRALPLFLTLAWVYTVSLVTKAIVYEKETGLRELLKILGLSQSTYWLNAFLVNFVLSTVSAGAMTALMSQCQLLTNSSPALVFCLIELFAVSTIALAFLFSTLFRRAKVAAASSGLLFLVLFLPYEAATLSSAGSGARSLLSLLSPSAFSFALELILFFEETGAGLQPHNVLSGKTACDTFSVGSAMAMLALDTVLYVLLAMYIDNVWPGDFGSGKRLLYFVQPGYWFPKRAPADGPAAGAGRGVRVDSLYKTYRRGCRPGGNRLYAVQDLSFRAEYGQVTGLLGSNGAGKSTTVGILTGLFKATKGRVQVDGLDIRTSITQVRRHLGLCPQRNALFDRLTVEEHLHFWMTLKGIPSSQREAEATQLLEDLELLPKRRCLSMDLSGGMKRKLSVALAFVGAPTCVVLDEPTAGMDPHARRLTWELVQKRKKGSCIIMSTHHMDEADILSDKVIILVDGVLKAAASPEEMKERYSSGYRLRMSLADGASSASVLAFVQSHICRAQTVRDTHGDLILGLPSGSAAAFAALFAALPAAKAQLGIESFGLQSTSLEDVFIRVVEAAVQDSTSSVPGGEEEEDDDDEMLDGRGADLEAPDVPMLGAEPAGLVFQSGVARWRTRLGGLLAKRLQYSRRDTLALASQYVLPILFCGLAMLVAAAFSPGSSSAPKSLNLDLDAFPCPATPIPYAQNGAEMQDIVLATRGGSRRYRNVTDEACEHLYCFGGSCHREEECLPCQRTGYPGECLLPLDMYNYALDTNEFQTREYLAALDAEYHPTKLFLQHSNLRFIKGWFDRREAHQEPALVNAINTGKLRLGANQPAARITAINAPVLASARETSRLYLQSGASLFVAVFVVLAMGFIPASVLVFTVHERVSKSKDMQLTMGATRLQYWLSNFLWDLAMYELAAMLCLAIFAGTGLPEYSGDNLSAVALSLVFYGWAIIPLMYPICLLFEVPARAYVTMIVANMLIGCSTVSTSYVLNQFKGLPTLEAIGAALADVFVVFPNYALGSSFLNIATRHYEYAYQTAVTEIEGRPPPPRPDPLAWDVSGKPIVALFIEGLAYFGLILAIECWQERRTRRCHRRRRAKGELARLAAAAHHLDEDVAVEQARVEQGRDPHYDGAPLVVRRLVKEYTRRRGQRHIAVRGLSFGLQQGECFGLLGVNGAGKTTTFSMLTGNLRPTSGEALIGGIDIASAPRKASRHFGYCPQFDALPDLLTGEETLRLYCRLRGLDAVSTDRTVQNSIRFLGLSRWAKRQTRTYSGGNKRKLSVAVALVGEPKLLLLDEPTTGMDPRARQFLWKRLKDILESGKAILLTSHRMGEAETLCSRMAIMVSGQLQCLGSPQHLKNKFESGYVVSVCTAQPVPETKDCFFAAFPEAVVDEEHEGCIKFTLPDSGAPSQLSDAFAALEAMRGRGAVRSYQLSQISLDEVFLKLSRSQQAAPDSDGNALQCGSPPSGGLRGVYEADSDSGDDLLLDGGGDVVGGEGMPLVDFAAYA